MDVTYGKIREFMNSYFEAFHAYAQKPDTTQRMYDYFAPDLDFYPYVAANKHITGRDKFLKLLSSHPSSFEKLEVKDLIIDEQRKIAGALIKAELLDTKTNDVLMSKSYYVNYQLALDEKDTLKIKNIIFFEEILPPGSVEIGDVFNKDPEMRQITL